MPNTINQVKNLNLSIAVAAFLASKEIVTVAQLCSYTEADLMSYAGFGQKKLDEINNALKGQNRYLGSEKFRDRTILERTELRAGFCSFDDVKYYRDLIAHLKAQDAKIAELSEEDVGCGD